MKLFTVIIRFEDRTNAILQVEAENETSALKLAFHTSEALAEYNQEAIEDTLENYLRITQLAMGYKGVWKWHHINFHCEAVSDIYCGEIIQTDKNGPARECSS
jgi:hypothetical protein